jgi:hypothetical protein
MTNGLKIIMDKLYNFFYYKLDPKTWDFLKIIFIVYM